MTEPIEQAISRRFWARLRAVANPKGGAKGERGRLAADPRAHLFGLLRAAGGPAASARDQDPEQPKLGAGAPTMSPRRTNSSGRIRVEAACSTPSHLERAWLELFQEVEAGDEYPAA